MAIKFEKYAKVEIPPSKNMQKYVNSVSKNMQKWVDKGSKNMYNSIEVEYVKA